MTGGGGIGGIRLKYEEGWAEGASGIVDRVLVDPWGKLSSVGAGRRSAHAATPQNMQNAESGKEEEKEGGGVCVCVCVTEGDLPGNF